MDVVVANVKCHQDHLQISPLCCSVARTRQMETNDKKRTEAPLIKMLT